MTTTFTDTPSRGEVSSSSKRTQAKRTPTEDGLGFNAPYEHQHNNKRPKLTIETLTDLLQRLGVSLRYNMISKDVEMVIPHAAFTPENRTAASVAWVESKIKTAGLDTWGLDGFLLNIADSNCYNPVTECILSKPWDGIDRLGALYNTIDAENNPAKEAFIARWMITAVAAAFEPEGIAAAGMLVLQGAQHLGKTYWFRQLLPESIRQVVFKDGLNLDPHNKDSVKKVVRHWIVELGEIDATFRRADLSALKAFITSDRDVMRMPYSRREQSFFRRTALCGTVNSRFFLHDQTGNRRFWTIACKSVDSYHTIDMQQAWAQVYELYKNGEGWRLTKQELDLVNDVNKEHEMLDYAACKVATFYDWELPCSNWKTVAEIADDLGIRSPTRGDLTSIGMAVAELNGGQRRRGHKGNLLAVPKKQGADFSWPQPD